MITTVTPFKQKHNTEQKVTFSSVLFSDTDACFYLFAKMEWKFFKRGEKNNEVCFEFMFAEMSKSDIRLL